MLRCCFDKNGNLDNNSFNQLAEKLHGMIMSCVKKYYLPGGDRDDLYQWGLLGLYKAVLHYDETDRYTFNFVASRNIRNMIRTAVTGANRKKNKLVNEAESLNTRPAFIHEGSVEKLDRLVASGHAYDPETMLADREFEETLYCFIRARLSDYERQAILLYMRGYTQQDISRKLNITTKVVDNAIQRAKRKIDRHVVRQNSDYKVGMSG
ncbi:MAG: sigma-70 family RNA polymerase sigma factor [Sporomusaceae bacterium]|nr:sigma-70 family RNA polymerase sigma factor [Sporomusaceae bacterium]